MYSSHCSNCNRIDFIPFFCSFEKKKKMKTKSFVYSADWRKNDWWGRDKPCSRHVNGVWSYGHGKENGKKSLEGLRETCLKNEVGSKVFFGAIRSNECFGTRWARNLGHNPEKNSYLRSELLIRPVRVYGAPTVEMCTVPGSRAMAVSKVEQVPDLVRLAF